MTDREASLKLNPQVNISRSTATRMWMVFFCAFFAVVQSSITDSGVSLIVALSTFVSTVLAELLMTGSVHGFAKIKDGSAAASALVLALLLPNHIHPMYAALGAVFAMVVVKHSFGGLGSNWLNPALGGWLFVRFSWPGVFAGALEGSSNYFSYTESTIDHLVSGLLNRTVFPFLGAELPAGYIDLLAQRAPGIIADRSGLVLVFGIILIAAFQISRTWLSILYLAVFGLLVRMLGDLPFGGSWWNGDVMLALLSGGTLVTAFILTADPSSGAKSAQGNAILAVCAAVLSLVFRYFGNVFYGCFFAIALLNALTPLLCKIERRLLYSSTQVCIIGPDGTGDSQGGVA